MFGWLYNALGSMLAWFESWSGSYAIALLFYALIFKIVFLPFAIKQQKNQIAMAKLAPKMQLIRAKYRGRVDRISQQKMQQEMMELQQKEGYSPFSGCLPMLIQLPLIIFLYNVIRSPLSYIAKASEGLIKLLNETLNGAGAKAVDEITLLSQILSHDNPALFLQSVVYTNPEGIEETLSLSAIPNFSLWGQSLASQPALSMLTTAAWWLVLIPVIAAASQWFTMWITKKVNANPMMQTGDAQTQMSMRIMDLIFPLMTLFIAFSFSGMLGLYWIYQSIIAIVQTVIIAKAMPLPKYTEEEMKEMRKAQREAEKAQRAALKTQPKFRSLHYIDEDDYDELPEVKTKNPKNNTKSSSGDMPEIKD